MAFEMDGHFREEREVLPPPGRTCWLSCSARSQRRRLLLRPTVENAVVKADASAEARFSRDLVDTYFRQMGNAELLSRDDEVALAKRIEAAQRAVLSGLCGVPMLIERLVRWGPNCARAGYVCAISSISRCIMKHRLRSIMVATSAPISTDRWRLAAGAKTMAARPSVKRVCWMVLPHAWMPAKSAA